MRGEEELLFGRREKWAVTLDVEVGDRMTFTLLSKGPPFFTLSTFSTNIYCDRHIFSLFLRIIAKPTLCHIVFIYLFNESLSTAYFPVPGALRGPGMYFTPSPPPMNLHSSGDTIYSINQ